MKLLVIFVSFSTIAWSFAASAQIEPILSQFQEADEQGQYQYSYESGIERKTEIRTPDGGIRGSYSYLDSDGKVRLVKYSAGRNGFQTESTNLPLEGASQIPEAPISSQNGEKQSEILRDTPEVLLAKMQHASAHAAVLTSLNKIRSNSINRQIPTFFERSQVLDDAARAQHAAAFKISPVTSYQTIFTPHHSSGTLKRAHTEFAEDVPRSSLGETPEVAAAREAHLAVYNKIRSHLPESNFQ